jgi:hypothetical protein
MGTDPLHRSARNTLARLARARMDNDIFRWEAAEVLEILSGIVRMPVCGRQISKVAVSGSLIGSTPTPCL